MEEARRNAVLPKKSSATLVVVPSHLVSEQQTIPSTSIYKLFLTFVAFPLHRYFNGKENSKSLRRT
jgi:hypothetical protein